MKTIETQGLLAMLFTVGGTVRFLFTDGWRRLRKLPVAGLDEAVGSN
jgi:hypothetical protein